MKVYSIFKNSIKNFKFFFKPLTENNFKPVALIPYFFTFLNAFFGLLAIVKIIENNLMAASYCIVFAAIVDRLNWMLYGYGLILPLVVVAILLSDWKKHSG